MIPQDFQKTAKHLSQSSFEADLRSSVSRAYYAALHTAYEALPDDRKPNLKAHNRSTHEKVVAAYDAWYRAPGNNRTDKRIIKETLLDIKKLRKKADYELDVNISDDEVQDSLDHTDLVIDLASRL